MEAAVDLPSFVEIDFETANSAPTSAVAMGLVRVDGGEVVAEVRELIRPWTSRFTFTGIHGLRSADVAGAAGLADVWGSVESLVRPVAFLAAHNARFDHGVLLASCERAGLETPRLPFICTLALVRSVWRLSPATLPEMCSYLGLELHHHEPLSDARACAEIIRHAWSTQLGRERIARLTRHRRRWVD